MSQNLDIPNFPNNNVTARTVITSDIAAGVSSLPVENSQNFAAGPVLIGAPGSSNPELLTATTPASAQTIPLSSVTKLPHDNFDPIILLFGNQIKVYSAADVYGNGTQPPDTNFTLVSGSPVNINGNSATTAFTDTNGVAGIWYKFTFYNSVTMAETALSDSNATQAGQTHYVSVDQVRRAAGLTNSRNVTNGRIAEFRDAAEKEVNGALLAVYQFPLPQPTNPIIVEIVKNLAAGELMHEVYLNVSLTQAGAGEKKADLARNGGGSHTSLQELVDREVVLEDANFVELTISEGHGFGGWPDATTQFVDQSATSPDGSIIDQGGDNGSQFQIDMEY